jgi:hypothetical protein
MGILESGLKTRESPQPISSEMKKMIFGVPPRGCAFTAVGGEQTDAVINSP